MKKLSLTLTAAVLASLLATGCAPLLIGGAMVGGVNVATDRRTDQCAADGAFKAEAVSLASGS